MPLGRYTQAATCQFFVSHHIHSRLVRKGHTTNANKDTPVVKDEETNDAEVFEEVVQVVEMARSPKPKSAQNYLS